MRSHCASPARQQNKTIKKSASPGQAGKPKRRVWPMSAPAAVRVASRCVLVSAFKFKSILRLRVAQRCLCALFRTSRDHYEPCSSSDRASVLFTSSPSSSDARLMHSVDLKPTIARRRCFPQSQAASLSDKRVLAREYCGARKHRAAFIAPREMMRDAVKRKR